MRRTASIVLTVRRTILSWCSIVTGIISRPGGRGVCLSACHPGGQKQQPLAGGQGPRANDAVSTTGELLRTIGTKASSDTGVPPDDMSSGAYRKVTHGGGPFNLPTDIDLTSSGEMFITDGYGNARVHKFAADGTYLFSGASRVPPGQFNLPHGVWIDKYGRVLVADRENDRVQVFDQEANCRRSGPRR